MNMKTEHALKSLHRVVGFETTSKDHDLERQKQFERRKQRLEEHRQEHRVPLARTN